MQSRQIQTFGLIGTSVLILFIVIFLGKDFYKLYQYYTSGAVLSGLGDEQIVMESHAVENLKNILDEESSRMLAGYDQEKRAEPIAPALKKEESLPSPVIQKEQKNAAEILKKEIVPVPMTPAVVTKKIRRLLGSVPFFHKNLNLTVRNKAVLDEVAAILQKISFPFVVEIEGHTEAGAAKYISQKMAQETALYLGKKLSDVKIKSIGYGSLYPVSDNIEDLSNRRIEILVRRSDI